MNNIVFANFECNETNKIVSQKVWQWNYGQILRIQGLDLPDAVEIHFSLQESGGTAVRRIGVTKDGVTDVVIPDFILENEGIERDYTAYAFIYLSTEESGQTEHRIELNIKSRPEPEGSTGSDETSFGAIMDAIKTFAAGKADGLKYENSILKLMSGETELARVTITGGGSGGTAREIELQKSDAAIQWRYVGDEEWTDLVLLEELKGEKGDPGEGGKTAYQYAQDGGYTGTEEEFAKKLAQENPTREEFSQLSDTVNDLVVTGGGITETAKILLLTVLKSCYTSSNQDANIEALEQELLGSGGVVILSSISATYSGGAVLVGTALTDLTGIVVTANYSDGTTKTVSDYTLSGNIADGSNTITVSYGGKTTTFTVIGYKEEEEPITLTCISATYTGGEVEVGTALTALTGLKVTGTYSDGSTSAITGYTLSGNIVEGSNTITVSYNGLTTTFVVTGVVIEEVVLTSISAVANETTVAVGTKAEDLDITVTAHYSDGTTATITDYSISGTVGVGENTFTIVYGGKTTTVTVTGNALVYSLYNKDMNEGDVAVDVVMNEPRTFTCKLDIEMNDTAFVGNTVKWIPLRDNVYASWIVVQERNGGNASCTFMKVDLDNYGVAGNNGYKSDAGDRHQYVFTYNADTCECAVYFAETPQNSTMVTKELKATVDKTLYDGVVNTGKYTHDHSILGGDYMLNAYEVSWDYTSAESAKAWFEREV